jgi:predicted component of type VI protein secretion system
MKLKLVLRGPERIMGAQPEKTLEHGSLLIGRSPAADWVLPDPARIVSKNHCRIDRDFSGFILTDTSTNGVEINDEPVGFGLPRLLSNGDVVKLGDVVVVVHVDRSASVVAVAPATSVAEQSAIGLPLDGPFGIPDNAPALVGAPSDSLTPSPATLGQAPGQSILDDWWLPQTTTGTSAEPISVDIFGEEAEDEILRTTQAKEPLRSGSGDVVSLVESHAGIDLMMFARAVDEAALGLDDDERRIFHERLRDMLAGNGSQPA